MEPLEPYKDQIENAFVYHKPRSEDLDKFLDIRQKAKAFALLIAGHCPPSRETSTALSKLEEVVMWANAGIARQGPVAP